MGIVSGRKLNDFFKSGWFSFFCNHYPTDKWDCRCLLSHLITDDIGNRLFLQSSLRGKSYIAAMKIAVKSKSWNFPAYLAITFLLILHLNAYLPFNSPM
jgi:hypothetical protein